MSEAFSRGELLVLQLMVEFHVGRRLYLNPMLVDGRLDFIMTREVKEDLRVLCHYIAEIKNKELITTYDDIHPDFFNSNYRTLLFDWSQKGLLLISLLFPEYRDKLLLITPEHTKKFT